MEIDALNSSESDQLASEPCAAGSTQLIVKPKVRENLFREKLC